MEHVDVLQILNQKYGIKDIEIINGPRQFVAETFIGSHEAVDKYFIKVIRKSNLPTKIVKSLPVLKYLYNSGLGQVPTIIPTLNKKLLIENSEFIFVVFSFIHGNQTFEYDNEKLGNFLAKLHEIKPNITIDVETFSSYVDEQFPKYFELSLKPTTDITQSEMRSIFLRYEGELKADWENFKKIITKCKTQRSDKFVLTHGDAPGNVMVNKDKLCVIDWDDIMIAPAERDIWFLKDNHDFMKGYLHKNPEYKNNKLYYSYYLYWRMFDDLFGWMNEIISDKSAIHKQKNLENLKKDYLNWLRPLVRNIPKSYFRLTNLLT